MALFGSVLRDDFRPESDVDVLVVFDPSARITFMTLGRMTRELSTLFQPYIIKAYDIVVLGDYIPEETQEFNSYIKEIANVCQY